MKILIIAKSESIHTARWISQIDDQGWKIHVFPSIDYGRTHLSLKNITVHHSIYDQRENGNKNDYAGIRLAFGSHHLRLFINKLLPNFRAKQLANVINKEKPDIVHIIEFQSAGYLFLRVKKYIKNMPKIILTNWGSDIYHFQQFKKDQVKIKKLLRGADYYTSECKRDVELAKKYGFKGKVLLTSPNAGGYKLGKLQKHKKPLEKRKLIMLKGYQGWSGRALVGLEILGKCIDIIKKNKYQIAIYSHQNNSKVFTEVKEFKRKHNYKIKIISKDSSHFDILKLHGRARISMGLGISDGISTSALESVVMGSFPIQSDTSCANEWIKSGENGYMISLENKKGMVGKIKKALLDDKLIKTAATINSRISKDQLAYFELQKKSIDMYKLVGK